MPKVFRISDAAEALNRSIVTGGEWEGSGTDKRPRAGCPNRLRTLISAYAGCNLPALAPNGGFGPGGVGPAECGCIGLAAPRGNGDGRRPADRMGAVQC